MVIFKILLFILGMVLMVQVIAALYGILDLWYTIRTAWFRVVLKIMIWGGITWLIVLLLNEPYRKAFFYGLAVYTGIFIAVPLFSKIAAAHISRPVKMKS